MITKLRAEDAQSVVRDILGALFRLKEEHRPISEETLAQATSFKRFRVRSVINSDYSLRSMMKELQQGSEVSAAH